MASIEYDKIYSCFLSKITDYKFLNLPTDDAYDIMRGWLHSAISKPFVRKEFSTIAFKDDILMLDFEIKRSIDKQSDEDYAVEIIAMGMVIEWIEPQVKSVVNMSQMFSGKEMKFYAQANHLSELKKMLDDAKVEIRRIIRDHGYFSGTLNSET